MSLVRTLHLACDQFWVTVRVRRVGGRWLASADTPDGPSLGLGCYLLEAVAGALEPFDGMVEPLLDDVAEELYDWC